MTREQKQVFSDDLWGGMVNTHWDLAKKHTANKAQIRIHCPISKKDNIRKTVIDVVSDDRAFLVDSVVVEINRHNLLIDFLCHPVLYVKYASNHTLVDVSTTPKNGYIRQSHMHIHVHEAVSPEVLQSLETGLHQALEDVFIANRDWPKMLGQLRDAREELVNAKTRTPSEQIRQYAEFLDYLYNNNFTLLGYREYQFEVGKSGIKSKVVKGSSLGLLHDDVTPAYLNDDHESLSNDLQELRYKLPILHIAKTNKLSTVHRRVPMDAIAIKVHDDKGQVIGEKLFLGLFTSVTYSRSVTDVPYLREKVAEVMALSKFTAGSHDYKALRHILEKYPRDELFQISTKNMLKIALDILSLQESQRIALFTRTDPFHRYVSCLVYVPRDRFGTDLRMEMTRVLAQELGGVCTSFMTSMDDSLFARVMFIVSINQKKAIKFDAKKLENILREIGQTWAERLSRTLHGRMDNHVYATEMTFKYGDAFPISYTSRYTSDQAFHDISKIEDVLKTNKLTLDLYQTGDAADHRLRLKVFNPDAPLNLSDVMPILEHMGIRAIAELPFEVKPQGHDKSVWIHDFLIEVNRRSKGLSLDDVKPVFAEAFSKVWYKEMESDGLNTLVLKIGMDWRDVTILRTMVRYLKQIRYPFGRLYIEKALHLYPEISGALVGYFKALHNPFAQEDAKTEAEKFKRKILSGLKNVDSLDQDKILRTILALTEATLRTNFFQSADGAYKSYVSLKFDCKAVPELPAPRPYREIFVYSPRMEGIHLRGDKIARGGIRWSDRHEDFRTEVLGLMKAQMVKNSVIVPMGAKGGFIVKNPPKEGGRPAFLQEGIECYKILVRGLLDITDNRKGEKIIPPKNVVCRDEVDPYLVVAADKGTASFSDIANGLSREYGFWLDDAFASGGSVGYDHKKMGITARGAWESVKMHFRQLNHNIQTSDFDVIGVGDMGGDVFGNGMLLSEHIRLVGAFNHLHIFCDPNPDTKATFKERKRLFDNVMGWDQYDPKLLSKGGRIFSRDEKTLTLTPEIQARFGIDKKQVSPPELMHAMLLARTDLLWFGGIGTYIKSSAETHVDVGDKANDSIRVNAKDIRAKVIGEGANLGVTQLARIEFENNGGKINTDFIDNSGGVDSSDHEVNIKILLTDVMANPKHKMTIKSRNVLLETMTEEVAGKVLSNNYQQALALSLAEFRTPENFQGQEDFIRYLERSRGLDRKLEGLPDAEEVDFRLKTGKGLTRPELAILLSYSKISFTQDLLAGNAPDQPYTQGWAMRYFPDILQKKFETEIGRHRLRREIIATRIASSLVNRMGPAFVRNLMEATGEESATIAKAYIIVLDVFALRDMWEAIESLDNKVPAEVQLRALRDISRLTDHAMAWFIDTFKGVTLSAEGVEKYCASAAEIRTNFVKIMTKTQKEELAERSRRLQNDGLPKAVADQMALLPIMTATCDIAHIHLEQKTDMIDTGSTYFEVGEMFDLDWLRRKASYITPESAWQAEAKYGLIDQLYASQAAITSKILKTTKKVKDVSVCKTWADQNAVRVATVQSVMDKLKQEGSLDFSMIMIATQKLQSL